MVWYRWGSALIPNGAYGEYAFDVTGIVTGWMNGCFDNFGIMLRGPESAAYRSYRGFATKESSSTPHLVVDYETPTPTPLATGTPTNTPTVTNTPTAT